MKELEDHPLSGARKLARVLDNAVRIPGTKIGFGLDALLGLVPGLGDTAGTALSAYLVVVGARLGAPSSVLLRMLGNVGVDTLFGSVPVVGDAFDVVWKSNSRNLALLERYLEQPAATHRSSFALVVAILLALGLLMAAGLFLALFVLRALLGSLQ